MVAAREVEVLVEVVVALVGLEGQAEEAVVVVAQTEECMEAQLAGAMKGAVGVGAVEQEVVGSVEAVLEEMATVVGMEEVAMLVE